MNREKMEQGIRLFLDGVLDGRGANPEVLDATPRRVARAWAEDLAAGYGEDPRSFLEPIQVERARGPVVLRGVRFTSLCAHHLLPFRGEASVGFLPREAHVGLGGIARMIDSLARRLCLQETLTAEIADHLNQALEPEAVVVLVEAEHLCLSVRGARKTGHRFRTLERRGSPSAELDALLL
ncbi:MAG: GTP cyclohydrolase I [Acidobacteriota bacterium]|nr:GTP cyclohydrolase I [Acidobacteriota bacterium]MDQ7088256.1 GTP cyclohydrolase I [Acidobacteriota bacterium]